MAGKITTQLVIDGINNAGKAIREAEGQLGKLSAAAKTAGAALAAAISVGAISAWVKTSIDAADANRKFAQSAGLAVEEYTALQYAAKLAGVETGSLNSAMARLNRTVAEAAVGGNTQAAAFARLGISVKDSAGALKTGDQILSEIAERFQELPDGVQKSAIAMELFGRSGTQLIPLLNGGAEGLAELRKEAEALGVVMNDTQAAQAEVFNDNLTRIGLASTGAANIVSRELLPSLVGLSDLFVEVNKDAGATDVIANILAFTMKVLASAVLFVGNGFGSLGRIIGASAAAALASAKGEFAQAAKIMRDVGAENAKAQGVMLKRIDELWSGAGEQRAKELTEQKRVEQEMLSTSKATVDALTADQKKLTAAIKERISAIKSAESAANSDLKRVRDERLKIEQRYQEALAGLSGTGEASYGAAQSLKVAARQSLQNGDITKAQSQAQAALKMIQDLAAAGENTYGFAGFIGELQDIELAANKIEDTNADNKLKAIKAELAGLSKQAEDLKNIKIGLDLSPETISAAKDQIQQLAKELGLLMVITPKINMPAIGSADADGYVMVGNDPAKPKGFATGGYIRGPGTGTSDSIPALLSNGEYVIRAAAVRKLGKNALDLLNRGIHIPRFADGGMVGAVSSMQSPTPQNLGSLDINVGGETFQVFANAGQADQLRMAAKKFGRTHR